MGFNRVSRWQIVWALMVSSIIVACTQVGGAPPPPPNPPDGPPPVTGSFPVLFVTQVPIASDFGTVNATFGNHLAGMLNAAFDSERPTVILYPKALLNDRDRGTSADVARQAIPVGVARRVRTGPSHQPDRLLPSLRSGP